MYDTAQEFFWLLSPIVLIGLLLAVNLVRSRTGRALGAVNDSEVAAECLGVNTYTLRLRVFVLSAAYAGLAGVFYAHWLTVVNPSAAGFELSVQLLLMVVLGGLGTVWGALIGSVAVQVLDEALRHFVPMVLPQASGEIQLIGFGVVLVLLVILLPGGLAQLWQMAIGRLRRPATEPEQTTGPTKDAESRRPSGLSGSSPTPRATRAGRSCCRFAA